MDDADPRGRVEHDRLDVAPHVTGPEVVVRRRVDRRDRDAPRRQRGRERVVQREALERVLGRPDAVEVATEPARRRLRVERADLVEVARHEVRLVRVVVADRGHHRHLALGVQRRQRPRRRMPAQPRVLAEHVARAGRERELGPQAPVRGVLGRGEDRDGVDPALEEDLHEHRPGRAGLRERRLGLQRREPSRAVHGEREPRGAQQERAPRQPGPGRRGHPGLDRGQPRAGARLRGPGEVAAGVGHQLVWRSGEVAISIRSAFWRRIA